MITRGTCYTGFMSFQNKALAAFISDRFGSLWRPHLLELYTGGDDIVNDIVPDQVFVARRLQNGRHQTFPCAIFCYGRDEWAVLPGA